MKTLKYFLGWMLFLVIATGCKKEKLDDVSFLASGTTPDKLGATFDVSQDNSGIVTITPNGEGAASYRVYFGDTTTMPATVMSGKGIAHKYAEGTYQVKIVAMGITGKTSEITKPVTVSYRLPEDLEITAAIDATNKMVVNVSAKAKYASSFLAYFGDVPNEVPRSFSIGETVSHTYSAAGTFVVKVVALSGGAATIEGTKSVTIVVPVGLPITFEPPTTTYPIVNFDGGNTTIINNPQPSGINTSSRVGKMVKSPGQVWGGSIISLGSSINFSTSKTFRMKVFSPRAGAKVLLKVENATNSALNYEKEATITVANAWQEVTFDYSGINTANTYQNVVLIFDLGTQGDGSPNFTFLFDDITL